MTQNWRTEVNAGDYFGHQQKKLQFADRRPVIRKPSDLVGPGIAPNAVRITNFNDLLASYNGFFSADAGAANAPNGIDAFAGTTVSDDSLGGVQTLTSLGGALTYRRVFTRSPLDPSTIFWGTWEYAATSAEMTALAARAFALESRATLLEDKVKPLYTGLVYFFMGSQPEGGTASGYATFPITFPVLPACWAIKAGYVSGSSQTIVSMVDEIHSYYCRISITNIGPALATFTDMPVRWFAQAPD